MPSRIVQQVKQLGRQVPSANLQVFEQYLYHLDHRESICMDTIAIDRKVAKHAKKKSSRSLAISKQYQGLRNSLVSDPLGYWHRPLVSPFHTKTGRDQVLGSSIVQISKNSWSDILLPPQGSIYVLLDIDQEEPMIAAVNAGCQRLLDLYRSGDIYSQLSEIITDSKISRDVFKTILLSRINGQGAEKISKKLNESQYVVQQWLVKLKEQLSPIDYFLDHQVYLAKQNGVMRSLDWQHFIKSSESNLSVRNWPLQATGADIMRRACLNLDGVNIPLLLTNHDSFLIRLDEANYTDQLELAIKALTDASVAVLNGFPLKVKVELSLPSKPEKCTNESKK